MNLTEDQIIEKYGKNVDIAIEILFFHTNMIVHVLPVDLT